MDLLLVDEDFEDSAESSRSGISDTVAENRDQPLQRTKPGPAPGHGGRKPLQETHPGLVQAVTDFAELHGFPAKERRHTDTAQTSGVLGQIRSLLKATFPDISIRKSTVR